MERPLLILDLDETLISSIELEPPFGYDFKVFHYFVRKRPHVDEFLRTVRQWYDLAVWTSSGEDYADRIAENVFGDETRLRFLWARSRCTLRFDPYGHRQVYTKNLKKVKRRGHDLARVLIIDDSPEVVRRSFGNHLQLSAWEGQADDRDLVDVLPYLEWLSGVDNFRRVEKRAWRTFA